MKKQLMLLLGILSLLIPAGFVISGSANADHTHKVFVCKYVGTPGVDEILQPSENNPIEVDVHSIPGYNGQEAEALIGLEFADQQGRSLVIEVSLTPGGGQGDEPSIEDCPPPDNPPTCPEDSEINAGEVIPEGETEATFCFEDDQEPPVCPDDSEINAGEVIPEGQTAEEFCFIDVQGEQTCPTDSEINAGEVIPEGETIRSYCNEDNPPPNPPNPPNPRGEQETPEVAGEQARAPVEVPTTVDSGL